ncbi:hypothetical protein U9M48_014804 [Paspalum notatum var. saurae]|uniref:MTD1 n=1 Tax=Paspalum notatum var. saurae TaxID=547442 RepID=A0AAQ3T295_PASNO
MSTALAEVRPAYGFPGSGKMSSGGEHEAAAAAVLSTSTGKRRSDGFFIEEEEEEVLTDTSSIGAPSPSGSSIGENSSSEAGGDEGDEEVESKLQERDGIGCLDTLEDALPIKKGLSSFYSGKSKSFTSLAEATSTVAAAKELAKPENPFNKRRRILANWSRRASCSSLTTATYLPPLLAPDHAVAEGDEGEEDDSDDDDVQLPLRRKNVRDAAALPLPPPLLGFVGMQRRNGNGLGGSFRSPRSFSLSDLQNSTTNASD